MSLFLSNKRDGTLVALTDGIVLRIDRGNVFELFSKQPEFTFSMIKDICRRLHLLEASNASSSGGKAAQHKIALSSGSPLFPEGHGNYILPLDNANDQQLFADTVECPICDQPFPHLTILKSRLVQASKDEDMRVRYKDIEPLYYEVITCPYCLYSAETDLFREVDLNRRKHDELDRLLAPYKGSVRLKSGTTRDTFSVFAGYYLAILEAPVCFHEHQRITARLWRNLSRIYDDCGDDAMTRRSLKNSADDYLYVYSNFDVSEKNMQQICYVIGEIMFKLREFRQARDFFYSAFTNKQGTPVVKRQAEIRLDIAKERVKEEELANKDD
jgi:uncharacterized protein (DUF2225 family)